MPKIYIDCGHGGTDSGAVGHNLMEKDINLSVGTKLMNLLLKQPNFTVRMSRVSDKYLSLAERTQDANNWGADIFISIHCNSATNTTARGVETFCYKFVSRDLADCVQKSVLEEETLYYYNRGVKEGNFAVIRDSNMKACLIELAFISNVSDAYILRTKQDMFALQIAKGICNYFKVSYVGGQAYVEPSTGYQIGDYGKDVKITATTLNVRSFRGTSYAVVGTLSKDEVVNVWYIDKDSDGKLWGSIGFKGQTGFIAMEYTVPK